MLREVLLALLGHTGDIIVDAEQVCFFSRILTRRIPCVMHWFVVRAGMVCKGSC